VSFAPRKALKNNNSGRGVDKYGTIISADVISCRGAARTRVIIFPPNAAYYNTDRRPFGCGGSHPAAE